MLGSIREPRADVLMAFPTVGETSSRNGELILKEHGIQMVTTTSGVRLRGRWNIALRYEGMDKRCGLSRFFGSDMVVLPRLAKTSDVKARSTGLRASTRTTIYPPANLCRRGAILSCNAKVHAAYRAYLDRPCFGVSDV